MYLRNEYLNDLRAKMKIKKQSRKVKKPEPGRKESTIRIFRQRLMDGNLAKQLADANDEYKGSKKKHSKMKKSHNGKRVTATSPTDEDCKLAEKDEIIRTLETDVGRNWS